MIHLLINEERSDYKCYDVLKDLYQNNEKFKLVLDQGVKLGLIQGFHEEIWDKIAMQNLRRIPSFEDVFRDGANIGYCTVASKQLSYSFAWCYICGGILPCLKGTKNCEDGSHTWISYNDKIIDSSLMLIIDEKYAKEFGYIEQNRYNPNRDSIYLAAKDFAMNSSIQKKKR